MDLDLSLSGLVELVGRGVLLEVDFVVKWLSYICMCCGFGVVWVVVYLYVLCFFLLFLIVWCVFYCGFCAVFFLLIVWWFLFRFFLLVVCIVFSFSSGVLYKLWL
jgi:hypothetical protein